MRRVFLLSVALVVIVASARGQNLSLDLVATGFSQPLFVTAPLNDSRLFVVEKGGTIDIVQNGSILPTPFLNISSLVDTTSERGLVGLTFDPNFTNNRRFYVDYIDKTTLNTTVVSYQTSASNPNVADLSTARTIITIAQPAGLSNHKGGWLGFRPGETANLYISTGDGGGGNDTNNNAQNLSSSLGKILRIDVSNSSDSQPYAIPASNPFAASSTAKKEIWAYGLRNPFRDSFDRLTGDFYIADVGQDTREEVDFVRNGSAGGQNFGWRTLEGNGQNPQYPNETPPANAVAPILSIEQSTGAGSITGGYVYRGDDIAGFAGQYLFGDFVSGKFTSFTYDPLSGTLSNLQDRTGQLDPNGTIGTNSISSFGEDGFGELYVVDLGGQVYKVVPEPAVGTLLLGAALTLAVIRRSRA